MVSRVNYRWIESEFHGGGLLILLISFWSITCRTFHLTSLVLGTSATSRIFVVIFRS